MERMYESQLSYLKTPFHNNETSFKNIKSGRGKDFSIKLTRERCKYSDGNCILISKTNKLNNVTKKTMRQQ